MFPSTYSKFVLTAGIASLVLLFSGYGVLYFQWPMPVPSVLPYALLYVFVVSSIGHLIVLRALVSKKQRFSAVFMGITGVKLLLYFAFVILYSFTHKDSAVGFLIWFMIYYLVFTAIDVVFLLNSNSKS